MLRARALQPNGVQDLTFFPGHFCGSSSVCIVESSLVTLRPESDLDYVWIQQEEVCGCSLYERQVVRQ